MKKVLGEANRPHSSSQLKGLGATLELCCSLLGVAKAECYRLGNLLYKEQRLIWFIDLETEKCTIKMPHLVRAFCCDIPQSKAS